MGVLVLAVQERWSFARVFDEGLVPSDVVSEGVGTRFVDLVKVNGGDVGGIDDYVCSAHDGILDE